MKPNSKTLQKIAAAATAFTGVVAAYGLLSSAQATAVSAGIAAIAAIWEAS